MGDAANASRRRLGSILLARKARYTDSENETTATAISKVGYTMAVSFWIAEPPQLSLFSINCSKPHELQHSKHTNFRYLPRGRRGGRRSSSSAPPSPKATAYELDNKVLELGREIEQERKQKKEQKLGIPSSVSKID
ncbi:hypothetical protein ZWY2020_046746 [Hordeum vulgare]|nr:hypothetical protein ZWY2020_046746 [Hordeum vulgare]